MWTFVMDSSSSVVSVTAFDMRHNAVNEAVLADVEGLRFPSPSRRRRGPWMSA